jgi:hypothetical protein
MLTTEAADFELSYNCMLERPFLIEFISVIHTTYALMKILGPKRVISIHSDLKDSFSCDMNSLSLT